MKNALNLVLIADSESTYNSVKIRPKIIDFRSFCVELWPKQVSYRISVLMSYITCWRLGHGIKNTITNIYTNRNMFECVVNDSEMLFNDVYMLC